MKDQAFLGWIFGAVLGALASLFAGDSVSLTIVSAVVGGVIGAAFFAIMALARQSDQEDPR